MIDNFLKELDKLSHKEKFDYFYNNQSNFIIYATVENVDYTNSWLMIENYGITLLNLKTIRIDYYSDYKIIQSETIIDPKLAKNINRVFLRLDKELDCMDRMNFIIRDNIRNNYYQILKTDYDIVIGHDSRKCPTFWMHEDCLTIIQNNIRNNEKIISREIIDDTMIWTETEHYTIMIDYKTTELTIMFDDEIIFYGIDMFKFSGQ